jgi:hypothetical protein
MRLKGLVAVSAALAACLMLTFIPAACKSHAAAEGTAASQPQSGTLVDFAQGIGLDVGTEPRNAGAVQLQPAAAAALRGGQGGIESMLGDAASAPAAAPEDLDRWNILTRSLSLFAHGPYVVDLLIGFMLSIAMALLLTTWPKSLVAHDPVAAMEERNGGVTVGVVGCLAAELVQSSEQLTMGAEIALVLFGIGGLIRFRTVFGDPRRTGLMILITILGLCCGMSQYALAVLGFVVIWFMRYFLLSSVILVVQVRPRKNTDMEQVRTATTAAITNRGATVRSSMIRRGGKVLEIQATARGALDEADLRQALEDAMPGARVQVTAS